MDQIEEWRPVDGSPGYEVSSLGRVRSLDRTVRRSNGSLQSVRGQMMTQRVKATGYRFVRLAGRYHYVHRLVLTAFVGPRPEDMETCHNDGDPANNVVGNLRWDTHAENNRDKSRHGTHHNLVKDVCPRGHPLTAWNLVARKSRRECRSCHYARTFVWRNPGADFSEVARRYFDRRAAQG